MFAVEEFFGPFASVTGLVALAEMGDKTQLLSLVLIARFRRPLPILAGILIATIVNHALAAWAGTWLEHLLQPKHLRWALGASFFAMAIWALRPDTLDDDEKPGRRSYGAFLTTVVVFFFAEIGDKTQIATTALAARYASLWLVASASTVGLMLANLPVVLLGQKILQRLPFGTLRRLAAAAFAATGVMILLEV